jgi:hypothetical protein
MSIVDSRPARRSPILFVGVLFVISWCAIGFDYYDRHLGQIGGVQIGIGAEIRGPVTVTDDKGKPILSVAAGQDWKGPLRPH